MATIISEAEVAAALEEALAEHSGDMESTFSVHEEDSHETKLQTIRYSFEPKNKNAEEIKDMNEYVLSYFESLNSMSRRIIAEQREVMAEQGSKWNNLTPEEQERLIDDRIADPVVRKHYFVDETFSTRKPEWFPVLRLAHGISGSDRSVVNQRDSITSVTDYHSKDQFSSPWSWETRSQQDLRILGEGELETQLKLTIEADLNRLHLPVAAECKKKELNDVEIQSKNSSQSDSPTGSEPLSRKQFLAVDFDGLKEHSSASSAQGSKSSLLSLSSLPKGSKGTPGSTTPPKRIKTNLSPAAPTEDNQASFSSTTTPKGSKTSLSSSPLVQTESKPKKEDANNQAVESDNTKDLDLSTATNSSDFMALFQNW